jgi:hypothetical protein
MASAYETSSDSTESVSKKQSDLMVEDKSVKYVVDEIIEDDSPTYYIKDKNDNQCGKFIYYNKHGVKEISIISLRYEYNEKNCLLRFSDLYQSIIDTIKKNKLDVKTLQLIDTSYFEIIHRNGESKRETFALQYIYLFDNPKKPSYYMADPIFNFDVRYPDSPFYIVTMRELERIVSVYKDTHPKYDLLKIGNELQLLTKKNKSKYDEDRQQIIDKEYNLFNQNFMSFKIYIDNYLNTDFQHLINIHITSNPTYINDPFLRRANSELRSTKVKQLKFTDVFYSLVKKIELQTDGGYYINSWFHHCY